MTFPSFRIAPALLLSILSLPAMGWQSERLADLRTTPWPASGGPEGLMAVGSKAFFSTVSGRGLWQSDGTAAGTEKLGPLRNPYRLGRAGGRHLFADAGLVGDYALWATGGTPDSTDRLAANLQGIDVEQPAVEIGDRSLIAVADETHGLEPWVSDGSPAGTHRLADLVPGPGDSNPNGFAKWRGRVYFVTSSAAGASLWATDGARVRPIASTPAPRSGSSRAYGLRALPGGLVFFTEGKGRGAEVWRSDGTARGTIRLARLTRRPVPDGGFVRDLLAVGDRLTFLLHLVEASGDDRNELWSTDGSAAGTVRLIDSVSLPNELGPAKRRLVYASDRDHGIELWASDGTPAGTRIAADLCPGPCSTYIDAITWMGERLALVARNPPAGNSATLWSIDLAAPVRRPVELARFAKFRSASALGAGPRRGTFEIDLFQKSWLWSTDGSRAGTHRLIEVPLLGFTAPGATLTDGTLLFSGYDALHGAELWRSDGTSEGTELVIDLAPEDYGGSVPEDLAGDGGLAAFVALDDTDRGLFVTDGTEVGTVRIQLGRGPVDVEGSPRSLGPKLCFALVHAGRASLWATDGTRSGTRDLLPAEASYASGGEDLVRLGGEVFFAARDPEHGAELWVSNGTRGGTRRILDLAPGTASAAPRGLIAGAGRLWFTADGPNGRALFVTDGSTEGAHEVPGPRPTESGGGAERDGRFWYLAYGTEEQSLVLASADEETGAKETDLGRADAFEAGPWRRVDDKLFLPYVASFGADIKRGLWVVDDGARFVAAPVVTGDPSMPTIGFAGRLFFAGNDASFYGRLWSSDGTPEGTGPFLDRDGASITSPSGAALLEGRAIFAGDGSNLAGAFWETDGTPAGTSKIEGAAPLYEPIVLPIPPRLTPWTSVGGRILYVSSDTGHGTEPWILSP